MRSYKDIKIGTKLPALCVALSVLTGCLTGVLAYAGMKASLQSVAEDKLETILDSRAADITTWYETLQSDITIQSTSPILQNAVQDFTSAWNELSGNKGLYVQDWYVQRNPNPNGSKQNLDSAADGSEYSRVHAQYHPYIRTLMRDYGYYDVFLLDMSGNIIYSVAKESDFGANLNTAKWATTDISSVYRATNTNSSATTSNISDLKFYGPSNDAPASFLAVPINSNTGNRLGTLIYQIPTDSLNDMMLNTSGLGQTGETFLVGDDSLLRSASRFKAIEDVLKVSINTVSSDAALAGDKGIIIEGGINGAEALAAYRPIHIGNLKWGIIATQHTNELFAPLVLLARKMAFQLALIMLLIALAGVYFSRGISRPLSSLKNSIKTIADGIYDCDVPAQDQKDEIGEIAHSLNGLRENLETANQAGREAIFKSAAFSGATSAMMMVDRDMVVTYINDSTANFFKTHEKEFSKEWPNFNSEKIVGSCIDIFHKNPSHQRQILSDPSRLPFKTDISIGDMNIELNISGVYDSAGEYIGNTLEWSDVTDDRLNAGMLDALDKSQATIEFGLDGTIENANENFLNALGYSLQEIKGKHHSIFVDDKYKDSPDYRAFWASLRHGQFQAGEFKRTGKKGNDVWIQAAYNPVIDSNGKPFKIVKFATDITEIFDERKRHAEEQKSQADAQSLVVNSLAEGLRKLANGDLANRIDIQFSTEYEMLRCDYNEAVSKLQEAMSAIVKTAEGIRHGSSEISAATTDISKRTENQAATLEETAAALDEITATVKRSADNAGEANNVAASAQNEAQESGNVVRDTVTAMGEIEKSSGKISQIIGVIDDIAFQTNLLALNAGVEAARAGDAGRGFAVVAQEVRALAQRSSDAAKQIKSLILASSQHVDAGVDLVGRAGEALESIVKRVEAINGLVSSIAISSNEQADSLSEANSAVNNMDKVTQQNASMVEETTAASRSLSNDAQELMRQISHFNIGESDNFLSIAMDEAHLNEDSRGTDSLEEQQKRVASFVANNSAQDDGFREPRKAWNGLD